MLLQHLREKYGIEELNSVHRLVAGACAGILAMSATYPLEMVRGRLTILNEAMGAQSPYKGIGDAAFQIVRAEGVMALYKGIMCTNFVHALMIMMIILSSTLRPCIQIQTLA